MNCTGALLRIVSSLSTNALIGHWELSTDRDDEGPDFLYRGRTGFHFQNVFSWYFVGNSVVPPRRLVVARPIESRVFGIIIIAIGVFVVTVVFEQSDGLRRRRTYRVARQRKFRAAPRTRRAPDLYTHARARLTLHRTIKHNRL